jgi:hypothetical protein
VWFDLLLLSAWSTGVFLGPLLTALPPYPRAAWWLWPGLRLAWLVGGGVAAGAATARLAGGQAAAMLGAGLGLGAVGLVLSVAPALALARGPQVATGRLRAADAHSRLQPALGQRVSHTEVELLTAEGPVRLRFRGIQGDRARRALEALRAAPSVQVATLPALRAFLYARAP